MKKIELLIGSLILLLSSCGTCLHDDDAIVDRYVSLFNKNDNELYCNVYPDSMAAEFLKKTIPLFQCPDKELEKTYYFRWWTYRKHIRKIPEGYVITEFLPDVGWAQKYNTINCAANHHIYEGRWLNDTTIISDYIKFWFFGSGNPRQYSFPAADAVWKYFLVKRDTALLRKMYSPLSENYSLWEKSHRDSTGLFWQMDGYDGMEVSVGGSYSKDCTGYRATINGYCYADAIALMKMASFLNLDEDSVKWEKEAAHLKYLVDSILWDPEKEFYMVKPRNGNVNLVPSRELHGYVPWMYDLPDEDKGSSWKFLFDTLGFKAPFGPTTAERCSPGFKVAYEGHECQWNGPSWPFATAETITAMARCINRFGEKFITKQQYFQQLQTYSSSHRMDTVCWIDENLNPFTGDWISRTLLIQRNCSIKERGKDYNHSTFCDLVISGLMGINPEADGTVTVSPLIPENSWDWFSLSRVFCAGREICLIYDKTGEHFGIKPGFHVYSNGKEVFHSDRVEPCRF